MDSADEFNPAAHITALNVRWDRGSEFDNLLPEAEFNYVTTREQQAKAKREEKQAINAAAGGEGGSDNGGGDVTGGDDQTE